MDQVTDDELAARLASPAGRYFIATTDYLTKLLDWKDRCNAHSHDDPEVQRICLREWGYLEHQGKILMETGRRIEGEK